MCGDIFQQGSQYADNGTPLVTYIMLVWYFKHY